MTDDSEPKARLYKKVVTDGVLVGSEVALTHDGAGHTAVNDFKGRSRSKVTEDGFIEIEVLGKPLSGTANEPNVLHVLVNALTTPGQPAPVLKPGVDGKGEDGLLTLPTGETFVVQIVSVPAERKHWEAVSTGKANVRISFKDAAAWIQGSIAKKMSGTDADRVKTILALDARHCAQVCNESVIAALKENFADPASHGFAQVWLVGPVVGRSKRLA